VFLSLEEFQQQIFDQKTAISAEKDIGTLMPRVVWRGVIALMFAGDYSPKMGGALPLWECRVRSLYLPRLSSCSFAVALCARHHEGQDGRGCLEEGFIINSAEMFAIHEFAFPTYQALEDGFVGPRRASLHAQVFQKAESRRVNSASWRG
jgi:hypothetical protein